MLQTRLSSAVAPNAPVAQTRRLFMPARGLLRALAIAGAVLAGTAMSVPTTPVSLAAPEPDPVPRRWQLDVEPSGLRVAQFDVPGVGPKLFFYMTYKVSNNTSEDLLFAPAFDLADDQGTLTRSGRDVPAEITRKLLESFGNPLLQDQIQVLGMLLQGEANAREGLVVWPVGSTRADEITVYGAGFSGETRNVEVKDPETAEIKRVTLRKTLMMRFKLPQDLRGLGTKPLELVEKRWVLR